MALLERRAQTPAVVNERRRERLVDCLWRVGLLALLALPLLLLLVQRKEVLCTVKPLDCDSAAVPKDSLSDVLRQRRLGQRPRAVLAAAGVG